MALSKHAANVVVCRCNFLDGCHLLSVAYIMLKTMHAQTGCHYGVAATAQHAKRTGIAFGFGRNVY